MYRESARSSTRLNGLATRGLLLGLGRRLREFGYSLPVERFMAFIQQGDGTLRDFNLAHVGSGSFATELSCPRHVRLTLIATEERISRFRSFVLESDLMHVSNESCPKSLCARSRNGAGT
jgi:hypothetical protein